MVGDKFDAIVASKMASTPLWFSGAEEPLSRADIDRERQGFGFELPSEYVHFAEHFGAGYFGSINISLLDPRSDWYRWDKPLRISDDQELLMVSDDEAGGHYGFLLKEGQCGHDVYYANLDDGRQVGKVEWISRLLFVRSRG